MTIIRNVGNLDEKMLYGGLLRSVFLSKVLILR